MKAKTKRETEKRIKEFEVEIEKLRNTKNKCSVR